MSTQIELVVGQTWQCKHGTKREIVAISHDCVCYWMTEDKEMWSASEHLFKNDFCHKLIPKTVKKSQSIVRLANGHEIVGNYLAASEDDAREHYGPVFVSWPLIINGVEQWVEVPSE